MANFKLSQLENIDIIDDDTYIMVVKNGKNYKVALNDAIEQNVNISDITGSIGDQISNIEVVNETQSEQIADLENTIKNIANNVVSSDDADKSFDEIFAY